MRECGNIVLLAEVSSFHFPVDVLHMIDHVLVGKTKKDVDNAKDGEGQLILAMLVNYVNMGGVNSVVGFCLNPTKVSLILASALSNAMYPLKGIRV